MVVQAVQEPEFFVYLSQILGKPVQDGQGRVIGSITDLSANLAELYPSVGTLRIRLQGVKSPHYIPWQDVTQANGSIRCEGSPKEALFLGENELFLRDALLDKQIVDTNGAKVRRVNDLQFLRSHERLHLVHVDVGFRGLMRRVGLEKAMDLFLQSLFDYELPNQFISWKYVQPVSSPDLLRLSITQNRLAQLHPADLADIIEDLDIHQRAAVFQSLDVETAAETLEETDPKIQVSLIETVTTDKASDIIEEMSLSEAADLLGDLPKDKAEGILKEMEQEIAEDVKELLAHPEEEAGGLMTTAYLGVPPETTAAQVLEILRREAMELDFIYYVYVMDPQERLLGMLSLRELLAAEPEAKVVDLMDTRFVTVRLNEEPEEIAEQFAKYGIMAVPVVDREERMKGVIPFRNLLELVAPKLGK
ncbi:MAG: magnesium transporter MgtE [Deltaproteobacteria bacterium HGW-Deltaproteobacteria-19]|jgi:CBS domain-containing protein/sporulation protein YlmC with PRC-barrel domain|nr:MAG: magnesium transporter MgtE [Deltaproteobacteria bacterium HGW-Deltaproteobacteria-19]